MQNGNKVSKEYKLKIYSNLERVPKIQNEKLKGYEERELVNAKNVLLYSMFFNP